KIEEWLKEGEVELEITRINMHGAPGAGKTCSQHLLLNEPPPSSTDSTPIACPAVKATRISIDGKNKWERVKEEDLLNQLASDFKEAPNETKHETTSTKINEAQMSSDRSGEPSLEDPTKNKPAEKKPTDMEVIKEISDALEKGNAKNLSKNWVYFIDSGGQPAYRELLPLFTRAAALNIITIDLTKGLDEKCKFQYRISQHMSPINTDLKYSNRDIIRSTISSEAMLNSIKIPYVAEPEKHKGIHARYLVLGTRKELVTEDELKEMDKSLISSSSSLDLKNIIQRIPEKSIIFPVNTLLPAGSEEREEACVELCTAISNCNLKMKIKLPIRLFAFEISLQREARNKKRSFLTKKEVIKIGEDLLLDESDIDDALQYLHNVTIILYYPAVLPNIIFVDPEPILDVLSRLIAITYIDQSNLHLIAKATDERIRLKECGLFKEDLLGKIGQQKIFDKDFESSHMITLLKHLHIIAEINSEGTGRDYAEIGADYFFPCALPSCDKLNDPPTEIQPLLIAWEIKNKGTITLAIPQGLFPLTIVHLLGQKDVVDFSPVGKEYYRCHDAMSLRVYKDYTIDIINRYTHIEIHFDGCKNLCPQIHELVTDAIKKSSKDINVNDDHIFAFKCSIGEHCYCIVKEDESSTRCTQCRSHCKVLQGDDDDSYRCWFNIPQLTSPGAKPSLERPPTTRPTVPPTGLLGTTDLIDVLDVLDDHEYSGVEYYDLGLRLGLHSRTLNVIKENNKGNVRSCLRECLAAWLEQRDSVMRRGGPTYNTFIKALRKMGENAVADGIERDINKNAVADAIEFH
uniref:Death domain-containing protein n=1 Tax=Amphimedon queenslandica TaxID=400682 RepID=A0A1X7TKP8_AMPQE